MKKLRFVPLIILFGLFSLDALAFRPSVEIIERFDDVRVVAFIDERDLADYPVWNPARGHVPLGVDEAIAAVTRRHDRLHAQGSTVKEVELREMAGRRDYWHYLVLTRDTSRPDARDEVYVVLMNGKVIPAIIEPESVK